MTTLLNELCEATSMTMADMCLMKMTGQPLPMRDARLVGIEARASERRAEARAILARHGVQAHFGPVQSSGVVGGQVLRFIAFSASFERPSPALLALANALGAQFGITGKRAGMRTLRLRLSSREARRRANAFKDAAFHFTGTRVHAINVQTGAPHVLSASCRGSAAELETGWALSVNVDQPIDQDALLHEVVHAKWPAGLPQVDEEVDRIVDGIRDASGGAVALDSRLLELAERERLESIQAFRAADVELRQLGILPERPSES